MAGGNVSLSNGIVSDEKAVGGTGRGQINGAPGGNGGAGSGGGLYVAGGVVSFDSESISDNQAIGGYAQGIFFQAGGDATGGGLYVSADVGVTGDRTSIFGDSVSAGADALDSPPTATASFADVAANSPGFGTYLSEGGTQTSITSSASLSVYDQSVTFTATLSTDPTPAVSPTGTMTFYDGNIFLGQVPLDASGQSVLTNSTLSSGSHSITAVYSGDSNFGGSGSVASVLTVIPAATTVAVISSADPSASGQPVTFTATVSPIFPSTASVDTGSVQFLIDGVDLGSPVNVNGSGVAVSMPAGSSQLSVGTHTITAVYSAGSNFLSSNNLDYSASVLGDSPSAYYPLNEASGTTAADASGNGDNATYSGGITFGVPGPVAGSTAIQLDGSTGSVSLPSAPFGNYPTSGSTTDYSLTFEVWFKAAPGSRGGVILSQANGGFVPAVMLGKNGEIYSSLFALLVG